MDNDRRGKQAGFTLVELLTSAVILVIITFSIVAVVMKGRELQVVDQHRRQARLILHDIMEDRFDYRRFETLNSGELQLPAEVISDRGDNPLFATISGVIQEETVELGQPPNVTSIELLKITVTATWEEADGTAESVSLTKWLADVQ